MTPLHVRYTPCTYDIPYTKGVSYAGAGTAKSLTMAEDEESFDEDEERRSSGSDWTEDCKRYGLQANGSLTMTMFFDSMYHQTMYCSTQLVSVPCCTLTSSCASSQVSIGRPVG